MQKKIPALLIAVLLLLSFPLNATAGDRIVFSTIIDAYYSDLDNDGAEDDIRLSILVEFINFGESDFNNGIEYGLIFGVVLPSGLDFWYQLTDIEYRTYTIIDLDLINQALESGWYDAYAGGFYREYDPNEPMFVHHVIFDPPGGQPGGQPSATAVKR